MSEQEHKAVFTADNKDLIRKADQVGQKSDWLSNKFKAIGGAIITAFSIRAIINFGKEAVDLASKIEGVRTAFERLATPDLLKNLREATRGTVTDLDLMVAAVKANNFQIPLERLALFFEFATKRALQTGESVDYLVQSIVLGIGRKSPLILDNLGISAVRLREKFGELGVENAGVGDVAQAVGDIVQEELTKMGTVADTTATKIASIKTSITNIKTAIGEKIAKSNLFNSIIEALDKIADKISSATGKYTDLTQDQLQAKKEELETQKEKLTQYGYEHEAQNESYKGLKKFSAEARANRNVIIEICSALELVEERLAKVNLLLAEKPPAGSSGSLLTGSTKKIITPDVISPDVIIPDIIPPDSAELDEIREDIENVALELTNAQKAAQLFGEEMVTANMDGVRSFKDFARVAVQTSKKIISAYIAEGVAAAVKKALTDVPFPFNIIAAGVAGGAAAALFNSIIPDFAAGGAASGPMLAMVGEAPGISKSNPEYMGTAKQLSQMGLGGGKLTCRVSRGDLLFMLNEGRASNSNNF